MCSTFLLASLITLSVVLLNASVACHCILNTFKWADQEDLEMVFSFTVLFT